MNDFILFWYLSLCPSALILQQMNWIWLYYMAFMSKFDIIWRNEDKYFSEIEKWNHEKGAFSIELNVTSW